jgi:phage terminase small subunit
MALTAQKQLFADRYVVLNDGRKGAGAQAARDAGYSQKAAAQQASRLLKDVDVIAYMESRVSPVLSTAPAIVGGKMEADEVLTRLTNIARGNLGEFITPGGNIDIAAGKGPLHLLKRVKTKHSEKMGDELEIEMYDALDALKVLAKHHRLIDRVAEDDWRKQFEEAGIDPDAFREFMIQRATERLEAGGK